jgi:hypothetical protein
VNTEPTPPEPTIVPGTSVPVPVDPLPGGDPAGEPVPEPVPETVPSPSTEPGPAPW